MERDLPLSTNSVLLGVPHRYFQTVDLSRNCGQFCRLPVLEGWAHSDPSALLIRRQSLQLVDLLSLPGICTEAGLQDYLGRFAK